MNLDTWLKGKRISDDTRAAVVYDYVNTDTPVEEIAAKYGIGTTALRRFVREAGVERRNPAISGVRDQDLHDAVVRDYANLEMTVAQIAAKHGIDPHTVWEWVHVTDTELRGSGGDTQSGFVMIPLSTRNGAVRDYMNGDPVSEIIDRYGISRDSLYHFLREQGFESRRNPHGTESVHRSPNRE